MSDIEKEILLAEAKRKYPKGTIAYSTLGPNNSKVISTGKFMYQEGGQGKEILIWFIDKDKSYVGWAYEKKKGKEGVWGEIEQLPIDNYTMY